MKRFFNLLPAAESVSEISILPYNVFINLNIYSLRWGVVSPFKHPAEGCI